MSLSLASGSTRTLNIDTLLLRAAQLSGLVHASFTADSPQFSDYLAMGRDFLEVELRALAAEGDFEQQIEFYDLALTADVEDYTLPDTTLDIVGDGMYINASEADVSRASGETIVKQVDRPTWHTISAKDAESNTPSIMYVNRGTLPVVIKFWPIPQEAGTVRLQRQVFSANANIGSKDIDLLPTWYKYILHTLAAYLCEAASLSSEKKMGLKMEARQAKEYAKSFAKKHQATRLRMGGLSGWGSR